MKALPEDITREMIESLDGLMRNYRYDPNAADYCCEFCSKTADTNQGSITHAADCDGKRFKDALLATLPEAEE